MRGSAAIPFLSLGAKEARPRGAAAVLTVLLSLIALLTLAPGPARAEATHILAVHAPNATDPRLRRMVLEFSAIEAVWREAGVVFVGVAAGVPVETMGTLPAGLTAASVARADPPAGGFGVRLIAASGRVVHAADAEVPRAVLLAQASLANGAGSPSSAVAAVAGDAGAPIEPPIEPPILPRIGPAPALRPLAVGAAAANAAAPIAAPTALDWSPRDGRATPEVETAPVPLAAASPPADPLLSDRGDEGGEGEGTVERAVGGSVEPPVHVPAPARETRRDAWSLWSGAPRAATVERVAAPPSGLPEPGEALAPALPREVVERVRAMAIEGRLAEARRHDGFEAGVLDAALPLGVQARMRFEAKPSIAGPDLGLALLVTGSCGAAVPERRSWRGWF